MRTFLLMIALLFAGPACSQKIPQAEFAKTSPAVIAFDVYMTCIRGEFTGGVPTFDTSDELEKFVEYLDDKCITWTVAWFPAFVGHPVSEMSATRLQVFMMLRDGVLAEVRKQFVSTLPKQPKK